MRPEIKDETANKDNIVTTRKRKITETLSSPSTATNTMAAERDTPKLPKHARLSLSSDTSASVATPAHTALLDSLTSSPATPPTTPSKPPRSSNRKQRIPSDPLNVSIYERRKEGREWDDIAKRTNEACGLSGENEISSAACYSRFFRNGPLVAKQKGEEFKKEWYVHMKGPVVINTSAGEDDGPVTRLSKAESAVLLRAVEKARSEFWANVTTEVNKQLVSNELSEEEVKTAYDGIKREVD